MLRLRRCSDRGRTRRDWLDSRHSFSFGDYFDREHAGFGVLRVINEDRVAPGKGFATHGHRDMEILTYVLEGALEHRDSLGNGSVIRPGEVQRMSAGTGVTHSEYNASAVNPVHFLQVWIEPQFRGIPPGYEQKAFDPAEKRGAFRVVASPDGRDGSLRIHQDAQVLASLLEAGEALDYPIRAGRSAYLFLARGRLHVNGLDLAAGDGLAAEDEAGLRLQAAASAEVLLFDLPRK